MKYFVVSVRDRAADVFGIPAFMPSIGVAIRSFQDEVNNTSNANSMLNKHPEDFDLYCIGTFDDSSGAFHIEQPRMVAVGKEMVRQVF